MMMERFRWYGVSFYAHGFSWKIWGTVKIDVLRLKVVTKKPVNYTFYIKCSTFLDSLKDLQESF